MRIATAALALAVLTGPTSATGDLFCESLEGPVRFELQSGIAHGQSYPFLGLHGTLSTGFAEISPDLRDVEIGSISLSNWWLDIEDLYLQFRVARQEGDADATTLTIKTKANGNDAYEGIFLVHSYETGPDGLPKANVEARGKAICTAQ